MTGAPYRLSPEGLRRALSVAEPPLYVYLTDALRGRVAEIIRCLEGEFPADRIRLYLPIFTNPCLPLLAELTSLDRRIGVLSNTIPELAAANAYFRRPETPLVFAGGTLWPQQVQQVCASADAYFATSTRNLATAVHHARPGLLVGARLDMFDGDGVGLRPQALLDFVASREEIAPWLHGLHAYVGPSRSAAAALRAAAAAMMSVAAQLPQCVELDLSGGWPFAYEHATAEAPSADVEWRQLVSDLRKLWDEYSGESRGWTLSWEPGRYLFAPVGSFVCRVMETRSTGAVTSEVFVDASFVQMPAPKLKGRSHRVVCHGSDGTVKRGAERFCRLRGATGLSTDYLLPQPVPLVVPEPGDLLVISDVGAYGRAGSYNFLGVQLPPEVEIVGDTARLLRARQTEQHLLDLLPSRPSDPSS